MLCDLGHNKDNHDCRVNFQGSAKAIEAEAGAALINRSEIPKEVRLNIRVVIGDEDNSTIASVRKSSLHSIHKLADKNYISKHFVNDLYELAKTFHQLKKKSVISHLKKCFFYAAAQNKRKSTQLAHILRSITDHTYIQSSREL